VDLIRVAPDRDQ